MSRSDRERIEAERAARRATRLADRAEQRAQRRGEHAKRASERAEELAERAYQRRSPRDRQRDQEGSFEDFVDDVAEKWSQKAEAWIDEKSQKIFAEDDTERDSVYSDTRNSAAVEARKARKSADAARKAAEDAAAYASNIRREPSRGKGREKSRLRRKYKESIRDSRLWRRTRRKRRYGVLYRDSVNKKICGVCAGTAEYFGVETWQVRLGALCGLFFMPQVAVPAYFITYFLMDKKPYYREATDRFDERHRPEEAVEPMRHRESENEEPRTSNVQAFRKAKSKFSQIEDRLRVMETHVTSSQFELRRELKKISGEDQ